MELSSTLQLGQMSLGDANELFPVPSPTSISPDTSHAPTFTSLPPEVIGHIFNSLPSRRYFYSEYTAPLASLCLVNRLFLDLARPLLYRSIRLNLKLDLFDRSSLVSKLVETLLFEQHCAGLVKTLTVFLGTEPEPLDLGLLRCLLRRLTGLQKISTEWNGWNKKETDIRDLSAAIEVEASSIKHLEIPNIGLVYPQSSFIISKMDELKTLAIMPFGVHTGATPRFKLNRVFFRSPVSQDSLTFWLSSSQDTLTSLSLVMNYPNPVKVDMFPNLSTLNLILSDRRLLAISSASPFGVFISATEDVLKSARSLPIKTLSLTLDSVELAKALSARSILSSLPLTLLSLGTVPQLLTDVDLASLFPKNRSSPCPSLKRLSILPPTFYHVIGIDEYDDLVVTFKRLSEMFRKNGIQVQVDVGVEDEQGFDHADVFAFGRGRSEIGACD